MGIINWRTNAWSAATATAILATVLGLSGCTGGKPDSYEWILQSQATADSLDFVELEQMAENVSAMSGGRLKILPVPGGEITNGPDIFSAVAERRVEMGSGWPNWWSGKHQAWAVMNAGPFDFMNLDASMMFFYSGGGIELANELSSQEGVIWRPAWWPGMEFGLLSKEKISGLDDLEGKKIRIGPGLPSEVFAEAAGASAVPLVPQEIRTSLERDLLDAVEWTTARGVLDLDLHDISPHAIVPAVWQPSVLADFLINQQAYEELPSDLQAILESAMKSYALTTTLKSKVADFDAMSELIAGGVSIETWSEEDIERWRAANEKILEEYSKRDQFMSRLLEKKKAFKKRYGDYYKYFDSYE